jgi:hypothetical protein
LLGGMDFVNSIIGTLLGGSPLTPEWTLNFVNLSPWEGLMESALLQMSVDPI